MGLKSLYKKYKIIIENWKGKEDKRGLQSIKKTSIKKTSVEWTIE